jgi:hypothetical protein
LSTDVTPQLPAESIYLGDAVHASFDGYQIWLKTGDGNNQQIAIEPNVYFALREFAKRFWEGA